VTSAAARREAASPALDTSSCLISAVAFFPQRAFEQSGHPDLVLDHEHSHESKLRGGTCGKAEGHR
jgi:hypothetical protein